MRLLSAILLVQLLCSYSFVIELEKLCNCSLMCTALMIIIQEELLKFSNYWSTFKKIDPTLDLSLTNLIWEIKYWKNIPSMHYKNPCAKQDSQSSALSSLSVDRKKVNKWLGKNWKLRFATCRIPDAHNLPCNRRVAGQKDRLLCLPKELAHCSRLERFLTFE